MDFLSEISKVAIELQSFRIRRNRCEHMDELCHAYNEVCDRLDVLLSKLHEEYMKKHEREAM
jgi:hypothetical protein